MSDTIISVFSRSQQASREEIDHQLWLTEELARSVDRLALPSVPIELVRPSSLLHGDYTSNVALTTFPKLKTLSTKFPCSNPRELAEMIVAELNQTRPTWVTDYTVAGPGFINIHLDQSLYLAKIGAFAQKQFRYQQEAVVGQVAIVEYSSPNIAKPFTVGHLRSTLIGDALANLLESAGYEVWRDNHLGDWGTQFGKQIYALLNLGAGEANLALIEASAQPVAELVKLYIEFHQRAEADPSLDEAARVWFAKLERGDPQALTLWQRCIEWSWSEFNQIYQRLGVNFSTRFAAGRGLGESFFRDKIEVVLDELRDKLGEGGTSEWAGAYRQSEGAWLVFFPESTLSPLMILKADGSTLYSTRDLATDYYRLTALQPKPDLIVNEVGAEQSEYFRQLFRVEEMLGWVQPGQRVHAGHGLYRFKDKKMSTRQGNVVWLNEVLDEGERRARHLLEARARARAGATSTYVEVADQAQQRELARAVSVAAIKWNDLKRSASLPIVFDWDEVLAMQGNSGPYLLYSVVRARHVLQALAEAVAGGMSVSVLLDTPPATWFTHPDYQWSSEEQTLLRLLYQYEAAALAAAANYAPHHLCTYLFELAQAFNSWYVVQKIVLWQPSSRSPRTLDELLPDSQARLGLTVAIHHVLSDGLRLLSIQTVDSM